METIATLKQDLLLTLRCLARAPRFVGFAITMVALSLGAHLAIVSVIDTVLLQPLPVREPEGLLAIHETRDGGGFHSLAHADFLEYRDRTRTFSQLAAHYSTAPLHVDFGDIREMVNGAVVSAGFFSLLGVEPGLGRFILPEEDAVRGTHPVVVLSDAMWRSRFGGAEEVLGSVLKVNDTAFTIVGVAPPGFVGLDTGRPCELWMPTMMAHVGSRWCDPVSSRECRLFEMVGRLTDGSSITTAKTEMDGLSHSLHVAHGLSGDVNRGLRVTPLTGLASERGLGARRTMALLMTVVTLVVVVAGANLAGLMIGRGLSRRREIAVRLALGAPRRRVVALFVGEALVLTAAAGIGGLLVAGWAGPIGALAFQTRIPVEVRISPTVLGYAALLCGLTGLAVGLVAGLRASRPGLVTVLGGEVGPGGRRPRLMAAFVVAQVAVCFVLLHATGLLTRSLVALLDAPSADPSTIATLRLRPRLVGYGPEQREAVVREVGRRIEALPGVRSVGFGKHRPLAPGFEATVSLPGQAPDVLQRLATLQPVSSQALEALGLPLLRGRDFDARDTADSHPVLLVNRTMAESLWPGQDAVGQRVTLRERTYEVIGVVQDCAYRNLIWGRGARAFSSFWQDTSRPDARFVVRFEGAAEAFLPALRDLVHGVDAAVPVTELSTLEQQLRRDLSQVHLANRLSGIAGLLAVLLSAAGLAGVLALMVRRRLREIGIRRALGADRRQVSALVVKDAMILVGLGLGSALPVSVAVRPALRRFLYGVRPEDPWVFGCAILLLAVVSAVATWLPARRAARVDPIAVLRAQ